MVHRLSRKGLVYAAMLVSALFAFPVLGDTTRPGTVSDSQLGMNTLPAAATVQMARADAEVIIKREPEVRIIERAPRIQLRVEVPGHYEYQKVMVRDGYYKDIRVWVSERFDPELNATFHGHYETRQHWVPPEYEYRKVWVPAD
ncbi:MAG: hypothetical protein HUU46_22190 [Candidatus Hydrogenedentes bacterium]|nr:hypothetical protein [Candidatus Hydrogenedentota bacterium]